MVRIRDHYFVAWLNVTKNVNYTVKENYVLIHINDKEYSEYLEEYKQDMKPVLKKIRSLVKEMNTINSPPSEKNLTN